jgi:hypothetical protein
VLGVEIVERDEVPGQLLRPMPLNIGTTLGPRQRQLRDIDEALTVQPTGETNVAAVAQPAGWRPAVRVGLVLLLRNI